MGSVFLDDKMEKSLNIFGGQLESCSTMPITGFFRNGVCDTCREDHGSHTVCAIMTNEFLAYSKYLGNDLSTPKPEFNFPGLKNGDNWCLCASRFLQAHHEGVAPKIRTKATHKKALEIVNLEILLQYKND